MQYIIFKEKYMPETNVNSLEYLSEAFKRLSADKKDYVLETARSLLKVQDYYSCLVSGRTASPGRKEELGFLDS